MEKLFLARTDSLVNANNILNSNLYGFRTNISLSQAAMELIQEISNAKDRKNHVVGVFIDIRKAFDTVYQGILIKKLLLIPWCAWSNK